MDEGQARARIGETIDRYVLEDLLGTGGFGAVYRARHTHMGRQVALKVLHPHPPPTEEMQQRFLREAQAAAAITEPGIVQVYDCGLTPKGEAFLAMELLDGEDLADHLAGRGSLSVARAVELTLAVLRPLGAAHAAGVVHRDLKPANVFLTAGGVKLLDFGISKLEGDGIAPLTKTGVVMGTPHYMAPETFRGASTVDHRADLYAVGAMLFEMLTGRPPHDADTYERLVVKVATQPAPGLASVIPAAPPELAQAVDRALHTDPDQRFTNAAELAAALGAFESNESRLGSAHTAAMPSTPPLVQPPFPQTRMAETADEVGPAPVAVAHQPSLPAATPVTHPHAVRPKGGPRRWMVIAGALVVGVGTAVAVPLALDVVSSADPKQVASEATGTPGPIAAPPAPSPAAPETTSTDVPAPSPTPTTDVRPPSPTTDVRPRSPTSDVRRPTTDVRPPRPTTDVRPPTPSPAAGPDSLRIGEPRIVGGLNPSVVRDLASRRAGAMRRCRQASAVDVKVQLIVSAGGRIAIAQPDPTEDPGPPEAARCVANVLREIGRVPDGQGIVFLSVHLPAR